MRARQRSQLGGWMKKRKSGELQLRRKKAHAISSLSPSHNSRSVTSHQVFDWHEEEGKGRKEREREGGRGTFVRHWEYGRRSTARHHRMLHRLQIPTSSSCVRGGIKGESVDLLACLAASLAPLHKRQKQRHDATTPRRPLQSPKRLLRFPPISGGDQKFSL